MSIFQVSGGWRPPFGCVRLFNSIYAVGTLYEGCIPSFIVLRQYFWFRGAGDPPFGVCGYLTPYMLWVPYMKGVYQVSSFYVNISGFGGLETPLLECAVI